MSQSEYSGSGAKLSDAVDMALWVCVIQLAANAARERLLVIAAKRNRTRR